MQENFLSSHLSKEKMRKLVMFYVLIRKGCENVGMRACKIGQVENKGIYEVNMLTVHEIIRKHDVMILFALTRFGIRI